MGRKSLVTDLEDEDFDGDFLPPPQADEFEATPEELDTLRRLLQDPTLFIDHEVYKPIHDKLAFYLQSGYKNHEVQGELALSDSEFSQLQAHTSREWWERHRAASHRWVARKRGHALRNRTSNDFAVLQAQDPAFSTKQINVNLTPEDTALTLEEREKLSRLFPTSAPQFIDVEPTKI